MAGLDDIRAALEQPGTDLDRVLQAVVDAVSAQLAADRATLYLIDHARSELVSRVAILPEIGEIRLKMGEGIAGWVAVTGEAVRLKLANPDPRFARWIDAATGYQTRSVLAVPVCAPLEPGSHASGGRRVGVIQLLNHRRGHFEAREEQALVGLAQEIGRLLAASPLGEQLRPGQQEPLFIGFAGIIGTSPAIREACARTRRAAATEATVLIRGESGTGKELIARAIHANSARRDGPFVKVDCAALPEGLIENELFGHEKGAFTGADRQVDGKVAAARGGTLFLDELGELPLALQGRLLRLLQDRSYFRVGGSREVAADVRFVGATHRPLEELVAAGTFRADLYYRLRVVEITLPALRERGEAELDRLIDHFLSVYLRKHRRSGGLALSPDARRKLQAWSWPGNIRELEHCLESAVILAPDDEILPEHVPVPSGRAEARGGVAAAPAAPWRTLEEMERAYIDQVLTHTGGNRSEAARILGIGRNTLLRKLQGERG